MFAKHFSFVSVGGVKEKDVPLFTRPPKIAEARKSQKVSYIGLMEENIERRSQERKPHTLCLDGRQ